MKNIFVIIILFIAVNIAHAQDYETKYNTRSVIIHYPDSIVKARILNSQKDFKVQDDALYYWYKNESIGMNRGGYNGNPLHGEYIVCTQNGLLITQGAFQNGLKERKWKTWYLSGELKSIENYKQGLKDDIQKYYSESGELDKEVKFKNGIKVDENKESFFKSVFKRTEKEEFVNDSTKTNKNIVQ